MKRIVLTRINEGHKACTLGVMTYENQFFLTTLERPWLDNKNNVSCIPKGVYKCVRWKSAKYANAWHVQNVPSREAILIHVGNFPKDTEGCILVGTEFGKDSVLNSKVALAKLNGLMQSLREFELEIK